MNAFPGFPARVSVCAMLTAAFGLPSSGCRKPAPSGSGWKHTGGKSIELPPPQKTGGLPLNEALARRRSHREFAAKELTGEQVSQLCWSGQGISSEGGLRTAPSAGALYPVTLLLADRRGVWEYRPESHSLASRRDEDVRKQLQTAALGQEMIGEAPACFIVAIDVSRTAEKYGKRAERYCLIEAGHVAQNLLLTATSQGLAAVPVGALDESRASSILGLPSRLEAIYLIPVGSPR